MMRTRELTYVKFQSRKRKPGPTARKTAKKRRAEGLVAKAVRRECVERDGYCRYAKVMSPTETCAGPSEWAHMGEKRRSKTRGMPPDMRHATATTLMLCKKHHDCYDNRRKPRLWIAPLSPEVGANGTMHFIIDE